MSEADETSEAREGLVVRILGEGQYDVADHALDRLNELDASLEAAVEAGDEAADVRWAAEVATTTAMSPIASAPTRWTAATARTSCRAATSSQTSCSRARAVGWAE